MRIQNQKIIQQLRGALASPPKLIKGACQEELRTFVGRIREAQRDFVASAASNENFEPQGFFNIRADIYQGGEHNKQLVADFSTHQRAGRISPRSFFRIIPQNSLGIDTLATLEQNGNILIMDKPALKSMSGEAERIQEILHRAGNGEAGYETVVDIMQSGLKPNSLFFNNKFHF